jgi:hypothetical protein
MITNQAMQDRLQEFLDEHGHYMNTADKFVFRDGAVLEHGSMGRMIPPPEDKWELAKLVAQYWLLVSQSDEQQFIDYQTYLGGTGQRQEAWANLDTEEEQLAYLRSLQLKAKKSRARYLAAKRKVKTETPFWFEEREQHEVEFARKKQQFRERVDSFQL